MRWTIRILLTVAVLGAMVLLWRLSETAATHRLLRQVRLDICQTAVLDSHEQRIRALERERGLGGRYAVEGKDEQGPGFGGKGAGQSGKRGGEGIWASLAEGADDAACAGTALREVSGRGLHRAGD